MNDERGERVRMNGAVSFATSIVRIERRRPEILPPEDSPAQVAVSPALPRIRRGHAGVPVPPALPVRSAPGPDHAGVRTRNDAKRNASDDVKEETRHGRYGANIIVGLSPEVDCRNGQETKAADRAKPCMTKTNSGSSNQQL